MRCSEMDGGNGWAPIRVNLMPQNCALNVAKMVSYVLVMFYHNFFPGVQQQSKSPQDYPGGPPLPPLETRGHLWDRGRLAPGTLLGAAGRLCTLPAGWSLQAGRHPDQLLNTRPPPSGAAYSTASDFCKSHHDSHSRAKLRQPRSTPGDAPREESPHLGVRGRPQCGARACVACHVRVGRGSVCAAYVCHVGGHHVWHVRLR